MWFPNVPDLAFHPGSGPATWVTETQSRAITKGRAGMSRKSGRRGPQRRLRKGLGGRRLPGGACVGATSGPQATAGQASPPQPERLWEAPCLRSPRATPPAGHQALQSPAHTGEGLWMRGDGETQRIKGRLNSPGRKIPEETLPSPPL